MLAIRGIYTGNHIRLMEQVHVRPNVRVIVTFLDDEPVSLDVDDATSGLLALSGTWEDERPADAIIREIYDSRTIGNEDIVL